MKYSSGTAIFAAVALIIAPAAASAQALDTFTWGGTQSGDGAPLANTSPGARVGPYFGTLDTYANNDGLIWCIDLTGQANETGPDVWVTPMGTWDWSKTERGGAYANNYRWTAFFANEMVRDYSAGPAAGDVAFSIRSQQVIWRLMGYTTNATVVDLTGWVTTNQAVLGLSNAEVIAINASISGGGSAIGLAPVIGPGFDYTKWAVITDVECGLAFVRQNGPCATDGQEMIANVPNPPDSTVPEPATMTLLATGLAGLAAARRRRKQG